MHLFPGQGDFTLNPLLPQLWSNQQLRAEVGDVFERVDPVGAEFGLRAIGPRLLGAGEVSTGALAAEQPGTLQLALFGICLAVHRTLAAAGFPARRILAVSFGEIPALTAAGACSVEDGARLACRLGQLLVRRHGGLTLLRVGERRARELLNAALADVAEVGGSTVVACVNDDDETIVSGPVKELTRVEELAGRLGISAARLRLPFPAHHPLLWREAGEFAHFARSLRLTAPRIPVYSAVAGHAYTATSDTDLPRALGACLVHPAVLPAVLRRATEGTQVVFEVGTGDALACSVRRSIPALTVRAPIAERSFPRSRNAETAGHPNFSGNSADSKLVDALVDDELLARGQVLMDDTTAHRKLRRLAASLPPAAQVYRDARLLAAVSEAVAVADPALYQTFLSHYILCVGSVADLGNASGAEDGERELAHAHAKGSFMVTEIGDASSHLGTRTLATYDPRGHRFVLHTPDARAAKFSSVAAAGLPQKAVVLARLLAAGRGHGVFSFLVDITGDDGTPCAGVQLSAPIALDAVPLPYGLVRFEHVSVPFERWLSDGARLAEDGDVHDPLGDPDARLQRTLNCGQGLWATLPSALAGMSARAAVLAWRYNSHRRSHGRLAPGSSVLTYRPQQHAIIGGLATAFALRCTAESALVAWERIRARDTVIATSNSNSNSMAFAPWAAVDRSLALYKAHTTQTTARLIDQLQHRCGVSGFFALNRLSGYLGFARAFDNAGGDNALTYVDAGRALAQQADSGGEHGEPASHSESLAGPMDAQWWLTVVATLQQRLAARLHERLAQRAAEGADGLDLWNPLLEQTRLLGSIHALRLAADAVAAHAHRLWPTLDRSVVDALAALDGVLHARRIAGHLLANMVLDPATVLCLPTVADELCDRLAPRLPDLAELLDTGARLAPSPMEEPDYAAALAAVLDFGGSDQ